MTEPLMHVVYRDGSVWVCRFCRRTWPYPSPIPASGGPCEPRPTEWSRDSR